MALSMGPGPIEASGKRCVEGRSDGGGPPAQWGSSDGSRSA
jgi:hypothetical protein